ncbi:unnamed protein product [Mytilus edulis]|uniref:Uncharacterized protein n=1 Tax=Mytilus edulis TaxID=6550 RepID=A0A8S3PUT5_MYTED|nr:unnamed protein product [Mytilus edulis]
MIVESYCNTIEIEVRTIGDGEIIVRYDFVCGPELIINGHFTMSSSSQITAEKIITTERSVCQIHEIDGTASETNEEICKVKTSGNIELNGHIYYVHDDRSVPSLLVVESQCGNITVMGIVEVPNLSLLTDPCRKLTIASQMSLGGYVSIGGACKTTIGELSNIECNGLIYQLTSEKSETRKINLDLNGSVIVHGLVNLDHIDDIVMFGTLSCHSISAKHADVIMTTSSITEIYYFKAVTDVLDINVVENITNNKDARLECTNGPLSISTKADMVNNGILISNEINNIWAADISNTGIIESCKSTVELCWGSKERVSIDGIVKSLLEIQFSSPFSKEFHFRCSGGMSNDSDRFVIPGNGIKLKCTKGSVVLKMDIEGRQTSANVSVLCMDGCKMHRNVTTSIFHLERAFEGEQMLGNQIITMDSHSEIFICG